MKNFALAHAPDGLFLQKRLDRNRQFTSPQGPRLLLISNYPTKRVIRCIPSAAGMCWNEMG